MSDDKRSVTTDPKQAEEVLGGSDAWLANLPLLERIRPMLTPEAVDFLRFLAPKKGLQEKVSELMNEVFHPYPDPDAIAALYRRIVLQDVWVLHGIEGSGKYLLYLAYIGLKSMGESRWFIEPREKIAAALIAFMVSEAGGESIPVEGISTILKDLLKVLEKECTISARLSRSVKRLVSKAPDAIRPQMDALLAWTLLCAYREWDAPEVRNFFATHDRALFGGFEDRLEEYRKALEQGRNIQNLPDFDDLAKEIVKLVASAGVAPIERVRMYLELFRLPPLEHYSQDILTRVTRELRRNDFVTDPDSATSLFEMLFPFLEALPVRYYPVVTAILKTLGVAVMKEGSDEVVHEFSRRMVAMPFPPPKVSGVDENWQIERHPAHLPMIRTYLEIIRAAPLRSSLLLAALHVNLRLHGVFISDTDLFQPDVSELLNSDISHVFKQVKQVCRLFPVFFREIGAEGELREYSTKIDEHLGRADKLIHFLRKQIHIESNNTLIDFTEDILKTWSDGVVERLFPYLPEDVRKFLDQEDRYLRSAFESVRTLMDVLEVREPLDLMQESPELMEQILVNRGLDPRPAWLVRIHTLLVAKYDLSAEGARDALMSARTTDHMAIETLFLEISEVKDLDSPATLSNRLLSALQKKALGAINKALEEMESLKAQILSPERSKPEENIYRKRHIAAGIPSMFGTYWERKLDALGALYRLENVVEMIMDRLVSSVDFTYFTRRGLRRMADIIEVFLKALELDGIQVHDIKPYMFMLKALVEREGYTLHQYVNVLQMMSQRVQSVIDRYFYGFHREALSIILDRAFDTVAERSKAEERIMREILSDGFGLAQLDAFLTRILNTLSEMRLALGQDRADKLLGYEPDIVIASFREINSNFVIQNGVFLGNKGFNLWRLQKQRYEVPDAFIVTTEAYKYRDVIRGFEPVYENFREDLMNHIHQLEANTGRKLGVVVKKDDFEQPPLLVSVRSGAAISMPGAMTTFLNVGLNEDNVRELADLQNYGWTAWDCYRRMIQSWGMVHGIPRDAFDEIIGEMKRRRGVERKLDLSPANMEEIAYNYLELLKKNGVEIPHDPYEQVLRAVELVLDSWDSDLARVYRRQFDISDAWGTAVIVQKMVLGNLNFDSGTGVAMTRTVGGDVELYGDYVMYSQGEDVVSGLVYPYPISEKERLQRGGEHSLERDFPRHYDALLQIARSQVLQEEYPDQEIEFTFEDSEQLYILQTRTLVKGYKDVVPVFSNPPDEPAAFGVPAGGGAFVGRVVLSRESIASMKDSGDPLILVRPDTVPDDVDMIFECGGLLTARGGITSHAAVTAARIGRVAVVGCRALMVDDEAREAEIGGVKVREGEWISIDGSTGAIYIGKLDTETSVSGDRTA